MEKEIKRDYYLDHLIESGVDEQNYNIFKHEIDTMLTNGKKTSTIVPNSTLDIEGSNGEGTGKAYYNRISRICYGASVHDLYLRQCAGGKVIAGMYAGSSQRPG